MQFWQSVTIIFISLNNQSSVFIFFRKESLRNREQEIDPAQESRQNNLAEESIAKIAQKSKYMIAEESQQNNVEQEKDQSSLDEESFSSFHSITIFPQDPANTWINRSLK